MAVGVLAGLIYLNSLEGEFVWDDRPLILQSPSVMSFDDLGEVFAGDFFSHSQIPLPYGYYRPLTTLSYVLDWALWDDSPFGFHLTNVLLHGAASILVLLILLRLGLGDGPALAAACLFAVHPIHTENVSWIAGRTDILAFVLTAAALMVYLVAFNDREDRLPPAKRKTSGKEKTRDRVPSKPSLRPLPLAVALALFVAALLAKEMAAVLPVWVFLIAFLHHNSGWRRALERTLPFAVVLVAYGVVRFLIVDVPAPAQPASISLGMTLISIPFTIVRYLWWMLLPLDLNAYVQNPYVSSIAEPRFWAGVLALVALTAGVLRLGKQRPQVALFGAMLGVSFLPILNIVRVASPEDMGNTMAERFCYFPSFPFVAMLVVAVPLLFPRIGRRARPVLATTTVILLLVVAAAVTWNRTRDWQDDVSLFTDTVAHAPQAALPWAQLVLAHVRNGRPTEARRALDEAIRFGPKEPTVIMMQTTLLVMEGKVRQAIPLQERLAHASGPGQPIALNNLAFLYRTDGRIEKARQILEELIEDGKAHSDVWYNLAEVEVQEKNWERSLRFFERARQLKPNDRRYSHRLHQVRILYARDLARTNQKAQAVEQLDKVAIESTDPALRRTAEAELGRLQTEGASRSAEGS